MFAYPLTAVNYFALFITRFFFAGQLLRAAISFVYVMFKICINDDFGETKNTDIDLISELVSGNECLMFVLEYFITYSLLLNRHRTAEALMTIRVTFCLFLVPVYGFWSIMKTFWCMHVCTLFLILEN